MNFDLALEIAARHCGTGSQDCEWYHGSWHLLKSLGVVSTSAMHESGLKALLINAIATSSLPRILITGSTDETLLRLVHETCQEQDKPATLVATDICDTPLAFMKHYADNNNFSLATYRSDILKFKPNQQFDVILTHAFMGYFDETKRPLLVSRWAELLATGGAIATIQRVRPAHMPDIVGFDAEQAETFVMSATAKAQELNYPLSLQTRAIETAKLFARRFSTYSIRSRQELEGLFLQAGLKFRTLEYRHYGKKGVLSGPAVPSDAEYAHLIAEKR